MQKERGAHSHWRMRALRSRSFVVFYTTNYMLCTVFVVVVVVDVVWLTGNLRPVCCLCVCVWMCNIFAGPWLIVI